MPKVPPKPAAMGKQPRVKKYAGPQIATEAPLSLEERTKLRTIFEEPVFRKAFSNARLAKPPVILPGLSTALGGQIALVQICRIQGWEMFEAALFLQTQDRKPKVAQVTETFPDAGL